jgi:hypothetical protein
MECNHALANHLNFGLTRVGGQDSTGLRLFTGSWRKSRPDWLLESHIRQPTPWP